MYTTKIILALKNVLKYLPKVNILEIKMFHNNLIYWFLTLLKKLKYLGNFDDFKKLRWSNTILLIF